MAAIEFRALDQDLDRWLSEDIGTGDLTSFLAIDRDLHGEGSIFVKEPCVVSGLIVAGRVFHRVDPELQIKFDVLDGARVETGQRLAVVSGKLQGILSGERLALNLLQRMSGISTLTQAFVNAVSTSGAKILDTRKTTPGLRYLEKYAVLIGGGKNHRFGLYDGILVKDNHIAAVGSVRDAVKQIKRDAPHYLKIEVEVSNTAELKQAIEAGADAVLLDNMSNEQLEEAVTIVAGRITTEASGNITLERVHSVAQTGVDLISVGALTHSNRAIDISLRLAKSF